ncbi:MAG: thioredoxin family protein [Bacilli bacterium]|nr:thioredoxin family protein [Bacilli bacterium]
MLVELKNTNELQKYIDENENVVVDFFATWCAPCRALGSVMHELEGEYPNITIVKVDVDKFMDLAMKYGVSSIPQVNIFKGGKEIGSFLGSRPSDEIRDLFDRLSK